MNLGKSFGIYTGIGVRNIGMINRLNDTIKIKQRVYALGIPVGIKLGDMQKRVYAALERSGVRDAATRLNAAWARTILKTVVK